jgi:putative secretion ATPase (PEP-CTERM system associated)
MYERFYNLRERPFSLTPDPDYLYPSRVHSEALGYLRYGVEGQAGFVVITGEIGSGKTTLLQTVLRGLDRQTSVSRLVNTMLDAKELLEAIMLDFGLDPGQGRSKPMLLRDLARFLVDQRLSGRLAMLVVDEAQNLSMTALEEVRMLSNLETEKSKLIQIVLVGQPDLRERLARPELEQLRQRITVSYHLQPLAADDTAAYVNHRLKRAAIAAPLQFSPDVNEIIYRYSQGVPRKINIIADAILLFGYGEDRHTIDAELTREVVEELEATGILAPMKPLDAAPTGPAAVDATQTAQSSVSVAGADKSGAAAAVLAQRKQELTARERDLTAREARLVEREQQLAEQRRLLAHEFRLTQAASGGSSGGAGTATRTAAWPPRASASTNHQPSISPSASSADSVWTRLRRGLFGSTVFEE